MRGWKWVGPAVAVLVLVTIVPLGRAIWTSLHRSSLTAPDDAPLVGIDNYVNVLTNRAWWLAVATTLLLVVLVVITQVLLGCVFGAALNRWSLAWAPARALVLLPLAVLSIVGVVMWRDAATTGFVAEWFGGADASTRSWFAVGVAEVWRGTGLVVVVVAVALSRVPASLLASAMADGATARQRWSRVVMPSIGPALAAIATFRVFDTFRVLDGPLLVDRASPARPVSVLMWNTQFTDFELGLGAAMSMVLVLMAVVLAAIVVPLVRVRNAL
ncbi:MAG: sugar ABC transporter permease [Aeromicrobium sp.]|uniref:carbohydrate ABC transporter permease n=1 Tax=Aeromicrobium sp. TaxID=1871063 RepID=UPI003C513296